GAGKTTFVRGLARGMGVSGDVMSPTFQLVRVYPGRVQLAHVDLYRVVDDAELGDLGLADLLDGGAVVVEWGGRLRRPGAVRRAGLVHGAAGRCQLRRRARDGPRSAAERPGLAGAAAGSRPGAGVAGRGGRARPPVLAGAGSRAAPGRAVRAAAGPAGGWLA